MSANESKLVALMHHEYNGIFRQLEGSTACQKSFCVIANSQDLWIAIVSALEYFCASAHHSQKCLVCERQFHTLIRFNFKDLWRGATNEAIMSCRSRCYESIY